MLKANSKGTLRALAILAFVLAVPALLSAQESTSHPSPSGPLAALDVPATELPPAPDTVTTPATPHPLTNASMFPVRAVEVEVPRQKPAAHQFWDFENRALFAASAGWAVGDFFVTRSNLSRGGRELNPITRVFAGSTPALAANFALEEGGVVGISYFFHKTGHHKLERMTSYVNISASAGAVLYGLTHR